MSTQAFGARLRELRKARWLTLRDLAELTGVDFTYLSKIETGNIEYAPSTDLICRIAQVLDADKHELLNLAGKMPQGLKKAAEDCPLLAELVRVLSEKRLPDETYRKMIELAKGG